MSQNVTFFQILVTKLRLPWRLQNQDESYDILKQVGFSSNRESSQHKNIVNENFAPQKSSVKRHTLVDVFVTMGWLRLVGCLKI